MLLLRKEPRGAWLSLSFAAAAAMTNIWAIEQSRSSTAGIAILGLPMLGALGGFLGLAFGRYRTSPDLSRRIGAWLALAGALGLGEGKMPGRTRLPANPARPVSAASGEGGPMPIRLTPQWRLGGALAG